MQQLKKFAVIGAVFVLLTGTLSHFLYKWSGNNFIVGLITPVNESVWEHMKMVFFPMLLYGLFMIFRLKHDNPCITSAFCLGILAGTLLIPILFRTYTSILGKDFFILDIGTFIVSVLIAFLIIYKLTLSCRAESCAFLLFALVCALFVCFILFTNRPPDFWLFQAPGSDGLPTWSVL